MTDAGYSVQCTILVNFQVWKSRHSNQPMMDRPSNGVLNKNKRNSVVAYQIEAFILFICCFPQILIWFRSCLSYTYSAFANINASIIVVVRTTQTGLVWWGHVWWIPASRVVSIDKCREISCNPIPPQIEAYHFVRPKVVMFEAAAAALKLSMCR